MFSQEFVPHVPIYRQIVESFQRALARGDLTPGDRVPAVRDLATRLVVNPNTVQRAYQEMEREGLLVTRRGQGTFVAEKPVEVQEIRNRLAELAARKYLGEMTDLGFSGEQAVDFLTGPLRAGGPPQNEGDR